MPTIQELIRETQKAVKDPTYDQDILEYFNEALHQVARSEEPLILLPQLETSGTVTTVRGDCKTNLPASYCRHLYKVESAANPHNDIYILPGKKALIREYGEGLTNTGDVEAVTIVGDKLYYQNIPDSPDTLTLYYYTYPPDFTLLDTNEITIIPKDFQRPILCGWAEYRIFKDKAVTAKDKFWLSMAADALATYKDGVQRLAYKIEFKSPKTRAYRRYPRYF